MSKKTHVVIGIDEEGYAHVFGPYVRKKARKVKETLYEHTNYEIIARIERLSKYEGEFDHND